MPLKNSYIQAALLVAALSFTSLACREDRRVQLYRIPKEVPPLTFSPSTPSTHAEAEGLHWSVPKNWKNGPAGSMRAGSYLFQDGQGGTADISVIKLGGPAGGLLANVNRWRGQIQLPPLTERTLQDQITRIPTPVGDALLVEFSSSVNKKGLVAATLKRPDATWFFKMTGPAQTLSAARQDFLALLGSLHSSRHE